MTANRRASYAPEFAASDMHGKRLQARATFLGPGANATMTNRTTRTAAANRLNRSGARHDGHAVTGFPRHASRVSSCETLACWALG